jgi:hypothetical protein
MFKPVIYSPVTQRINIFLKICTLFLCLKVTGLSAQILNDSVTLDLIKKDVSYIYNLQSDSAYNTLLKISNSYPEHPVVYLLKGMKTYWENFPLIPSSPARLSYENDMFTCIGLCDKKSNRDEDTEYVLASLCARGMLLLFYSDNDLRREVFPLVKSTYKYLRRAFDYASVYPDFLFFTGLYNYYREAYPEAHPFYKTLAFLFPEGNKPKGLTELQEAAKKSIFLKAESFSFLSYIYEGYENNPREALYYIKALHELYPNNYQYLAIYIENLLLLKQYDEAESLIKYSGTLINNPYFQAQLVIFNGILQEKRYHFYTQAQQYYYKGLNDISQFGDFGDEFAAFAYFGLSRISELTGNKNYKKFYRRKAIELAEFKNVNFDN